jgi:nucleoside-diphosphate-sugar epimerase
MFMRPSKVLVTGASGFIGGRVVERLALEGYDRVRALVHKWSRAARVAKFPIEIVAGDIMSREDAAAAMKGVTHVVHCAFGDAPEVIIEGTRNLLAAALDAGVERFVYVSTAEVYGAKASGTIDETTPTEHTGRTYGDAKIDAERLCREYHERGLSTAIVRPAIVYGPFGRSWTVGTAKRLLSGRWSEFEGYGDGLCNAVYVDDLASAILLAAEQPAASGETFNVNGPEVVTWNEYFRKLNTAMQLPPLTKKSASQSARRTALMSRVETVIRSIVSRFEDRLMEIYLRGGKASQVMKWVKSMFDSTPSQGELEDLYSRKAIYADDKAHQLLGYQPKFDLNRGMAMSVLWMARSGYIDNPALAVHKVAEGVAPQSQETIDYQQPVAAASH